MPSHFPNYILSMKAKAFLFAALCAMSFSLVACGGATEEAPATMDTTVATEPVSAPVADTVATVAPADTAAASTTVSTDTAAAGADTTAK